MENLAHLVGEERAGVKAIAVTRRAREAHRLKVQTSPVAVVDASPAHPVKISNQVIVCGFE